MKQFSDHYMAYFDKVYRFIFWRTGGRHEVAEDIASDTWLKALSAYGSYDQARSFAPWIITIAKNNIINFYRTRGREIQEADLPAADDGTSVLESLGEKKDHRLDTDYDLYLALQNLTGREKEIIELKYLQGFSYKEIGAIYGESDGTVKVAAHRALKQLKEIIKKYV